MGQFVIKSNQQAVQGLQPNKFRISALLDVKLANLTNGQILIYDSTTGTWKNGTGSGGGSPTGSQYNVQVNDGAGGFYGDSNFYYNYTTGRVGINTTNPQTTLQLGNPGTVNGVLSLAGFTSGLVRIQTRNVAGTWTLALPDNQGNALQVLQSDGTGQTNWVDLPSSGVLTVGSLDGVASSSNGLSISGTTLYAQSASTTYAGLVNTTTQSFKGKKTVTNTFIDATGGQNGLQSDLTISNTANSTGLGAIGILGNLIITDNFNHNNANDLTIGTAGVVDINGNGLVGTVIGLAGQASNNGSGTTDSATGVIGYVGSSSTGTVTNAYAHSAFVEKVVGATITNAYGYFVQDLQGTNNYGIHADVVGSKNVLHELQIKAGSSVKYFNSGSTFYTALKGGANTGNLTLTLPLADGSSGQVMTTDGAGNLSFTTPTGSGGSLLIYMFKNASSDISTYIQAVPISQYTVGALGTVTTAGVSTTPTLLGVFATNSGYPNATVIPTGISTIHVDTEKVSGANNYYIYAEVYKRTTGGTETLVATSDQSTQTASNTQINQTVTALITSNVSLNITDRIVVKVYGVMVSSTATIKLYYDDSTSARVELPAVISTGANLGSIAVTFNGQGGVITTGQNGSGCMSIPYSGIITGWTILSTNGTTGAVTSGSIVIDTWKDTYANFPPVVGDSIWGGSKPTLSSASKNTTTGLSIAVTAGDGFIFNVDSVTSCLNVTLIVFITKS